MTDALDPCTRWIYEESRARTDTISISPVLSQEIEQIIRLTDPDRVPVASEDPPGGTVKRFLRYFESNQNSDPLRNVLKSFLRYGRISGLLERPYYDLEFWSTHAGFYDRCFREHARFCERFHFFRFSAIAKCSDPFNPELEKTFLADLAKELYQGKKWEEITEHFRRQNGTELAYSGYLVLRPIPSYCVQRAAIRFDGRPEKQLALDLGLSVKDALARVRSIDLEHGGTPILKTRLPCRANLLATALELRTIEFMQQDTTLGTCATVSLWVATQVTAERFHLNRFSYAETTRRAIGDIGLLEGANLDEGLFDDEIARLLSEIGARPLSFRFQDGKSVEAESMQLRQELYSFTESGVPVILCLAETTSGHDSGDAGGHAVVVVGHSFPAFEAVAEAGFVQRANEFMPGVKANHSLVSTAVPVYYVHDDAYGPFNRVAFLSDGGAKEYESLGVGHYEPGLEGDANEGVETYDALEQPCPIVKLGGKNAAPMYIENVIVPVPPMVHGGTTERLWSVLEWFDKRFLWVFEEQFGKSVRILWRSLLVEGAEFKASTARRDYSAQIVEWYARMMLSKYVWLFEFSVIHEANPMEHQFAPATERDIFGEFLVDPTTPAGSFRCLACRICENGYDYRPGIGNDANDKDVNYALPSKVFEFDDKRLIYKCYRPTESRGESDATEPKKTAEV